MKKFKNIPENVFIKLFFLFISVAFLIAAVCMPDRGQMLAGLGRIVTSPAKIATNYFSIGGYAATFLNMGLVALACTALYQITGAKPNNVAVFAFLLTLGFCSWGIHIVNMWFTIAGVALFALLKKEALGASVNAMLFSTGTAPFISELLVRYPNADAVGFNLLGIVLAIAAGLIVGLIVSAGLAHSPNVHKGFNLYSAALPVGMSVFLLNGMFYKVLGIDLPGVPGDPAVASAPIVNIFCCVLFGRCILLALLMGGTPREYWGLLKNTDRVTSVTGAYGNGVFLMNVGVYGLFIVGYYNLVGASFNGVLLGLIFCMLCTCNSGSRPTNVWPIMAGYVAASLVCGWISPLLGGNFALAAGAPAIATGLCYANGLSPICDKYGWRYGFLAAVLHYCLVTLVPGLHGGFCLYNGGFTGIFVCILLVPILEKYCKTKEERRALKAK
ncbi:MAG: DUF1576 domain-containing protein [Firmicutes bacterium]|nr:DUF1576 domain-containing protein [Bacillota bacterium]